MLSRSPSYDDFCSLVFKNDKIEQLFDEFENCIAEIATPTKVWNVYNKILLTKSSKRKLIIRCLAIAKLGNTWNYSWIKPFLLEQLNLYPKSSNTSPRSNEISPRSE